MEQKSRFRTRGGFTNSVAIYRSKTYPNGVSYSGFRVGEYTTMSDVVTKRFRELQSSGAVVMTPSHRVTVRRTVDPISHGFGYDNGSPSQWWSYEGAPRTSWCLGLTSSSVLIPDGYLLHSASEVNALVREVCTRVRSQRNRGSTNTWENLAEIDKTLALLRHPLSSWSKFRRKNSRIFDQIQDPANGYLVWRYGVSPLIKGVTDVMHAVKKAAESGSVSRRETTRSRVRSELSSATQFSLGNLRDGLFTGTLSQKETVEVRAMAIDTIEMDFQYTYGLSVKDLLTLPYELVPYSFVADWFANTGDFLGALADMLYPSELGSCYTLEVSSSVTKQNFTASSDNVVFTFQSPELARVEENRKIISRVPGLVDPGLVIKSDFRFDSAARWGDSLALIAQQILPILARKPAKTSLKDVPHVSRLQH